MRFSIATLCLGVVGFCATPPTMAQPIPEYRASYRNVVETAAGSADATLSYDSDSRAYTYTVKRVDEEEHEVVRTLRFTLVDDRVRPSSYRQQDRRCGNCTFAARFDWDGRRVQLDQGGDQGISRFTATEVGRGRSSLIRDVAMLVAQLPGRRELAGFDDILAAEPLGTVEITTPVGPVQAEGRALHGATEEALWLAPELQHLPVRIQAFGMTLELAELDGIELSATPPAAAAERGAITAPPPSDEAAATPVPEYRAVYRLDDKRTVGAGRLEIAVSHDRTSDRYDLVATMIEVKRPERVLVEKMPFRLVGDRVQPLGVHMEERGRRVNTGTIEFNWALHEVILRFDEREERYPLITFQDRDEQGPPIAVLEPLAAMIALLPGSREIAGFDDVLSSESLGAADVSLPIGPLTVERFVLRGKGKDMSFEVWRARELADLPVRVTGPVMVRNATTFELTELHGLERAVASSAAP